MTYLDLSSAADYYVAPELTEDDDAGMYLRGNFFYPATIDGQTQVDGRPTDP